MNNPIISYLSNNRFNMIDVVTISIVSSAFLDGKYIAAILIAVIGGLISLIVERK